MHNSSLYKLAHSVQLGHCNAPATGACPITIQYCAEWSSVAWVWNLANRGPTTSGSMCRYSGILWLPPGNMHKMHMDYLRRSSASSQKPLCQSAEPWCPAASSCCMRASSCSFSISGKACELLPDTSEGPVSNAAACSSCRQVLKASQLYVKLPQ